jgi:two-component system LytT family response regulator
MEAADDYTKIYTADGVFLKNKTMSFYEQSLPANSFVRTHRSYIVNVQEITRIEPYEKENHLAILRSGARIPVSKSGYTKLKAVLGI